MITEGYEAATPALQRVVSAFGDGALTVDEGLRWLWLGAHAASLVWDDGAWYALSARQLSSRGRPGRCRSWRWS